MTNAGQDVSRWKVRSERGLTRQSAVPGTHSTGFGGPYASLGLCWPAADMTPASTMAARRTCRAMLCSSCGWGMKRQRRRREVSGHASSSTGRDSNAGGAILAVVSGLNLMHLRSSPALYTPGQLPTHVSGGRIPFGRAQGPLAYQAPVSGRTTGASQRSPTPRYNWVFLATQFSMPRFPPWCWVTAVARRLHCTSTGTAAGVHAQAGKLGRRARPSIAPLVLIHQGCSSSRFPSNSRAAMLTTHASQLDCINNL